MQHLIKSGSATRRLALALAFNVAPLIMSPAMAAAEQTGPSSNVGIPMVGALSAGDRAIADGRYEDARRYYEQAHESGLATGAYKLGEFYASKQYGHLDLRKSFAWHDKAARAGLLKSQFILATYYEDGIGTAVDLNKAIFWYQQADKNGHTKAAERIQQLRQKQARKPAPDAPAKTKTFSEEELRLGEELNQMGRRLFKVNPDQAIATLKIATNHGSARAAVLLALVYMQGKFAPKDMGKYYHYMTMAADFGDAEAQTQLGIDYVLGTAALPQNLVKGTYYLVLAARQGQPQAQETLRTMNISWQ